MPITKEKVEKEELKATRSDSIRSSSMDETSTCLKTPSIENLLQIIRATLELHELQLYSCVLLI